MTEPVGVQRAVRRLRRIWGSAESLQWRVLLVLLVVAVVSTITAILVFDQGWGAALLNFGTEMTGAFMTYLLLQRVLGREVTKEELIAQMGSTVNDVAVAAAEELRRWA